MKDIHKLIGIGIKPDATHVAVFEKDTKETFLTIVHGMHVASQGMNAEEETAYRLDEISRMISNMAWMDMSGAGAFVAYSEDVGADSVCMRICKELKKRYGGRVFVTDTSYTVELGEDTECFNDKSFDIQLMNLIHVMKRFRA